MNKDLGYYMGLNYRIEIIKDIEEGGYALHCPELRGCITCGETIEQGLEMIEDAKKCWFTACIEDGIEIPEPSTIDEYSGEFKLRMPKSLHKTLVERSRQEGISMNQYCLYLLSSGIDTAYNGKISSPNKSTRQAIYEAENDVNLRKFDTAEEMFKELSI
jgi:predicted RNase H-like HicB family nuclease